MPPKKRFDQVITILKYINYKKRRYLTSKVLGLHESRINLAALLQTLLQPARRGITAPTNTDETHSSLTHPEYLDNIITKNTSQIPDNNPLTTTCGQARSTHKWLTQCTLGTVHASTREELGTGALPTQTTSNKSTRTTMLHVAEQQRIQS